MEISKYYHENWDGTGYPLGLSRANIPLSARIVAVVHMYTTLNSDGMIPTSCFQRGTVKND